MQSEEIRKDVQFALTITFQNAKMLQQVDHAKEVVMYASKLTVSSPMPSA